MDDQPTLETQRLRLRPFEDDDSRSLATLLGDPSIGANLVGVPKSYTEFDAQAHIAQSHTRFAEGAAAYFAITSSNSGNLLGEIIFEIDAKHRRAELGYWLGEPYWGRGFMKEALPALLDYGFHTLKFNRIFARAFIRNSASLKILEQAGFQREGVLRQDMFKDGEFFDVALYGLLRSDYIAE